MLSYSQSSYVDAIEASPRILEAVSGVAVETGGGTKRDRSSSRTGKSGSTQRNLVKRHATTWDL